MTTILIILYFITVFVNYGGLFSYVQRQYPLTANQSYRKDMAISLGISLIPIAGIVVGFFATGFYKHGFKFI